jgi:zinc/manganese transport system ATP-binding protein
VRNDPAIVRLEDATVRLAGRTVWHDVSLAIEPGEFAAILGPNGAGKSTLLKVLLGLLPLAAGRAEVLGRPAGEANAEIGYLPQFRHFDDSSRIRGLDVVRLGLDGARWGVPLPFRRNDPRRAAVREAIDLVRGDGLGTRPIGRLSGGEQQRLLIAQALVRKPRLLMLDEPLDSLDLPSQGALAALLQRICRERGVAVLLVAHDVNPLLGYLDRVIYLAGGEAVAGPPAEVITTETLTRLYAAPIEVLQTATGRLVVVGSPEAPHVHGARHEH